MTTIVRNGAGSVAAAASPLTYTGSFADVTTDDATAIQVFAPGTNVNGAYVEMINVNGLASTANFVEDVTFLAKNAAPASGVDGDIVGRFLVGGTSIINLTQITRIKIPAGKGLYINQKNTAGLLSSLNKTVLYTIL